MNDYDPVPVCPGQEGRNRQAIGRNWVKAMASFAEEKGVECRYSFEMIPGVGHSMTGLLPFSQAALVSEVR